MHVFSCSKFGIPSVTHGLRDSIGGCGGQLRRSERRADVLPCHGRAAAAAAGRAGSLVSRVRGPWSPYNRTLITANPLTLRRDREPDSKVMAQHDDHAVASTRVVNLFWFCIVAYVSGPIAALASGWPRCEVAHFLGGARQGLEPDARRVCKDVTGP